MSYCVFFPIVFELLLCSVVFRVNPRVVCALCVLPATLTLSFCLPPSPACCPHRWTGGAEGALQVHHRRARSDLHRDVWLLNTPCSLSPTDPLSGGDITLRYHYTGHNQSQSLHVHTLWSSYSSTQPLGFPCGPVYWLPRCINTGWVTATWRRSVGCCLHHCHQPCHHHRRVPRFLPC